MRVLLKQRLRTSVILLLVGTTLMTLAIVGTGILAVMIPRISEQNQAQVSAAAADMAARVELFLEDVESRVARAGAFYRRVPADRLSEILEIARSSTVEAIYLVGADGQFAGKLINSSIPGSSPARNRELEGIDLSSYPLFRAALERDRVVWSDKHISAVTGKVTVGVATPVANRGAVVIAEVPLGTLVDISRIARSGGGLDHWIVDRRGELVADTDEDDAGGRMNLYSLPIVRAGLNAEPLPDTMTFRNRDYQVSASRSQELGWLFVSRVPAGLENAHIREVVAIVLVSFAGSVVVGLLLAPIWAQGIVRPLRAVADRAHQIANGARPDSWPSGSIVELNQLSGDLGMMSEAIQRREEELRQLNEELEDRVARRTEELTRSNKNLSEALTTIEQAKDELIQSEKLAALGRLVAGVAHELNTPLGNGRIAVTTLADKLTRFQRKLSEGLRRSELDSFIQGVQTSTDIAERNLLRASRLIASFKQVAADRTASRRRRFQLLEVIDEVVLTVSPSMKQLPVDIKLAIPDDIFFDSYPGELGQVLTNLIENCAAHAFIGRAEGTIEISAARPQPGKVILTLRDDGIGMSPQVARKAFDPFFTTSLGRGGTGLGLFIVHNAVTNVLAGSVSLRSTPGEGTTFEIRLPLTAPNASAELAESCAPAAAHQTD